MKRTIALCIVLLLALSLFAGCGKKAAPDPVEQLPQTSEPTPPEQLPLRWQVRDEAGHTLYLFGTIHAGDERSKAILAGLTPLLDACDALAVEFDVVAFEQDMKSATILLKQFFYQDGTTVQEHLSEEQYAGLKALLEDAGIHPALMERCNLALWEQTAEQALLTRYSKLDFDLAMDRLLLQAAKDRGMEIVEVESAAFQYNLINSFSEELYRLQIDRLLQQDGAAYGEALDTLFEAWSRGDETELTELLSEEEETEDLTEAELALLEDYGKRMLDDRNSGMCSKAADCLRSGKTVLFAVGTAHLLGPNGLVQLLKNEGYTVERLP